ncbi:hypothetical protein MPDQ_008155 [Monascus purpureus]|uniref:Uncharacterized protein n=1 Tax=Monascus purpureus TaxID=5098 RepID=A0A507QSE2_MONPU|nr:hypothetical protein MPDQ_008155 [Monascus purpureus]BDD57990.1 hypothetical protein MAP00_003303 [Monascus purpureus]
MDYPLFCMKFPDLWSPVRTAGGDNGRRISKSRRRQGNLVWLVPSKSKRTRVHIRIYVSNAETSIVDTHARTMVAGSAPSATGGVQTSLLGWEYLFPSNIKRM